MLKKCFFPLTVKELERKAIINIRDTGDMDWIPELGKSSGGGNGNPLQYSCLGNPMDKGAWWATVHRIANGWT